ncbi:hypothetical protein NIES806_21860 [Dolichospermum compactum NIES-806]|uniref:Uncharacterized protein n=1 Tax=Dolichospermum compactum NIES-806 TaxID=1973481 RepID=A0A1Z4V377_9CYAN|nr:hypothetical protein NIES806_21860 [Dolichospermum compactum NIES-806]
MFPNATAVNVEWEILGFWYAFSHSLFIYMNILIVNFAVDYATQVEYDYNSFKNAYNSGATLY